MADRYIKQLVISDADHCKVMLDNGDELRGVVSIETGRVHVNWFPKVTMTVLLSGRHDDG
jgi:hypothetical protein